MPVRYLAAVAAVSGVCLTPAAAEPVASAAPGAHTGPEAIQLAAIRRGHAPVPAQVQRDMPAVLASKARAAERKRVFLKTVLPAVLRANARIRQERRFLAHVAGRRAAGQALDAPARRKLARLARRYETEPDELAALRRRVDIVPPSLALAQAAIESGWGSSRFAQKANALFGQRVYGCSDCGIKPRGYDSDPGFRVRRFPTVMASVRAYMDNLNTHPAYRAFRTQRRHARRAGLALDGHDLAGTLTRYSERREAYVRDVRRTIAANDLTEFDGARLVRHAAPRRAAR